MRKYLIIIAASIIGSTLITLILKSLGVNQSAGITGGVIGGIVGALSANYLNKK